MGNGTSKPKFRSVSQLNFWTHAPTPLTFQTILVLAILIQHLPDQIGKSQGQTSQCCIFLSLSTGLGLVTISSLAI